MNFISLGNPNVLINADQITCIEQRIIGITSVTYIWVGEKEYVLGITLEELWKKLGIGDMNSGGQHFAG